MKIPELKTLHKSTPICPNCGAKFSHDNTNMNCRVCGLPDEVAYGGKKALRKYQRRILAEQGLSRADMKVAAKTTGARKSRSKPKHGRTHKVRA
jgi:predicted amidophosphoribosyltransferase